MIDFVGKRYWYFLLSALIILPGLLSLALPPGLRLGIDFTSGSVLNLGFEQPMTQAALREELANLGLHEAVIQRSGDGYLIRTRLLAPEEKDATGTVTKPAEKDQIVQALGQKLGKVEVLGYDTVSPVVATETVKNASIAVAAASIGILLYLAWAFRQVPHPFRYGTCAIAALLHVILLVVGLYSIFGKVFGLEVDAMFITALLTVIGFSVHDTIVVFDRIRENLRRGYGDFGATVNHSIMQTLGRSLTTSLTTLLALLVLYLFGGVTIRNFVLVLLVGITSGTYSSIFNASQLLVAWEVGDFRRLRARLGLGNRTALAAR
ncbi:MAG: protein translocase subunit SecF [Chloroflexi bacterium]|nr:protein translocase subunit SecF [Chloroflexota bacterium]